MFEILKFGVGAALLSFAVLSTVYGITIILGIAP